MTSPISFDSSEDLFSQYATWLLKEGIWDGVPVTWKDAASLGKLVYKIDDPETALFKTIHRETFEEAVSKINLSKGDSILCGENKACI